MAYRRGRGPAREDLRNNPQLQQFVLTDVTPTGRILGTGSYGSVEQVLMNKHFVCAAKKIHETLIEAGNEGVADVVSKYEQECQLMSSLRHPNITQFLGLCFLPEARLPLLVMECLDSSLDSLLENMPDLPLTLKRSVLEDVARGLVYLHKRTPPVIHRDLTSRNVLLTSSLVAKITDMGNSRIIEMRPGQMARTLSKLPGTLVYMPPEALDENHRYGPSLDIFSFGHLALYTITQSFPGNLLQSTFLNPDNPQNIQARTEVQRRGRYFELLENLIGRLHPSLVQLIKQCLHNAPAERPATEEVLERLQRMRAEVEGGYGSSVVKLDIHKVLMSKEMKEKEKRIQELIQQEERSHTEMDEMTRELERCQNELEQLNAELEIRNAQNQELLANVGTKDSHIVSKEREVIVRESRIHHLQSQVEDKERQIQLMGNEIRAKDGQIRSKNEEITQQQSTVTTVLAQMEEMCKDWEAKETRLREDVYSRELEIKALTEELMRLHGVKEEAEKSVSQPFKLKFPLQLTWKHGPSMPHAMGGAIQSVVVRGMVYVGGGFTQSSESNRIVMEYNPQSGKWSKLPEYKTHGFAMTLMNNQLVLVGGVDHNGQKSKILGTWKADSREWKYPFPEMPTPRYQCSATVYEEWLIVTGGWSEGKGRVPFVEGLNTRNKQWYTGPPLPVTWNGMKSAIVGDTWYLMGGYIGKGLICTDKVFSLSLPAIISQLYSTHSNSQESDGDVRVEEIAGLKYKRSFPLSINGSLLAFGGEDSKTTSAIHLYRASQGDWVKVGDLPSSRCECICAVVDKQVLVAGGAFMPFLNIYIRIKKTDVAWLK